MERGKVSSSKIRSVGYDERARVLEVEHSDGSVYQYTGVSQEVHRRMMEVELIGRLPVISALDHLSEEAMHSILLEPKNALLKQYKKLFAMDGIDLQFREDAIEAIVTKAKDLGTGARGLRAVMEDTMLEIMFDIHSKNNIARCIITRETVEQKAEPIFEPDKATA